jgi:hypothetical protein
MVLLLLGLRVANSSAFSRPNFMNIGLLGIYMFVIHSLAVDTGGQTSIR